MFKKHQKDDYIGPSKGWAKFFHRLFLLVTFPLRKPWWMLLILLVMFLAPTFMGVKPAEVHLWYWNLLKQSSTEVSHKVADKAKELVAELPQVIDNAPMDETTAPVANLPQRESRRKMFERAKSAPVVVSAAAPVVVAAPRPQVQQAAEPVQKKIELVYLKEPKIVSGTAEITNANELTIGKEEMFLFGVYADPSSENGMVAADFLRQTTAGQVVNCTVNAYTYQSVATAICHVGTINLNRELVDRGFSKNVALD